MKKPPAFQFYAKDFLVGTMEMSLVEIGAYAKLLAWSWDNGPVPSDDRKRATILGVSERSLRSIWTGISDKWVAVDGGFVNERLEHQRRLLAEFKDRQSERGRSGALGRWRKHDVSMPQVKHAPQSQAQPDDGSSVCDLQSANPLRKEHSEGHTLRARDAGLINGSSIRRHGTHAWCSLPREGLCVPVFLHEEFIGKLGRPDAAQALRAWYAATVAKFDGVAVGEDSLRFWRNEFATWVGTVTTTPATAIGRRTAAQTTIATANRG